MTRYIRYAEHGLIATVQWPGLQTGFHPRDGTDHGVSPGVEELPGRTRLEVGRAMTLVPVGWTTVTGTWDPRTGGYLQWPYQWVIMP